jgi:hypothetical protein
MAVQSLKQTKDKWRAAAGQRKSCSMVLDPAM